MPTRRSLTLALAVRSNRPNISGLLYNSRFDGRRGLSFAPNVALFDHALPGALDVTVDEAFDAAWANRLRGLGRMLDIEVLANGAAKLSR